MLYGMVKLKRKEKKRKDGFWSDEQHCGCINLSNEKYLTSNSIFKSRDITLPTKVCLVKAIVFPVVMYECETWTMKKAEH